MSVSVRLPSVKMRMSLTMSLMRSTCLRMRVWAWARASGRMSGPVKHLGGQADDAERIFQVMDDGAGKIADHGQAFGLDDFAEVNLVEFAQAVADVLQQAEGQRGRALDEREHFAARKEINVRIFDRGGGGRARAMFDHGHFAENLPGPELGKDMPVAVADEAGNFHQPVLDEINAVAGVAFMENLGLGGKMPFLGDKPQGLQFIAAQIAKQSNGFKRNHEPHFMRKFGIVKPRDAKKNTWM